MNVLVIGATGFLGQHLTNQLIEQGFSVTAHGRNANIGEQMSRAGVCFVQGDLTNREATIAACLEQDYIIHCAAFSSPWGRYREFYRTNVEGTENVLNGAMKAGVRRFIHVSSPSIYMDYRNRLNIMENETLPANSVNYYAQTKRLAEQKVDEATKNGLDVVTIRPRAIFGPGDNAILPRILRASKKGFLPLFNENALVDVTYVDNVVRAIMSILVAPGWIAGRKYNITNGDPRPIKSILQLLFDELGLEFRPIRIPYEVAYSIAAMLEVFHTLIPWVGEPVLTRYSVGVIAKSQTLNIDAAKIDLGYEPLVSIDEGIKRFAVWWKKHAS